MHIERIHKMIECLTEKALAELNNGTEHIDTCEFGEVVDMIKDLNEAEYRAVIVKSMKEADEEEKEYKEELLRNLEQEYAEEGGRRFYNHYHYKNGRFAPKGRGMRRGYEEPMYHMPLEMYHDYTPEELRDMDRHTKGVMYYTEPMNMSNSESRYDKAKRMYTETKEMHKGNTAEDKQITLKEGEKMLNVIFDEIDEMLQDASPEMRSMVKTKGMARMQKIQ